MNMNLRDILMNMNPRDICAERLIFCPPTDETAIRYTEIAADTAWLRRERFHPLVDWGLTRKIRCCLSILIRRGRLKWVKLSLQARMPRLRAPPAKGRRFEQYATAGGEHDEYAVGRKRTADAASG